MPRCQWQLKWYNCIIQCCAPPLSTLPAWYNVFHTLVNCIYKFYTMLLSPSFNSVYKIIQCCKKVPTLHQYSTRLIWRMSACVLILCPLSLYCPFIDCLLLSLYCPFIDCPLSLYCPFIDFPLSLYCPFIDFPLSLLPLDWLPLSLYCPFIDCPLSLYCPFIDCLPLSLYCPFIDCLFATFCSLQHYEHYLFIMRSILWHLLLDSHW